MQASIHRRDTKASHLLVPVARADHLAQGKLGMALLIWQAIPLREHWQDNPDRSIRLFPPNRPKSPEGCPKVCLCLRHGLKISERVVSSLVQALLAP